MSNTELTLNELKKRCSSFQKKYELPTFEQLNEDFQIEKICENETDFLIREIRKFIADRLYNTLRFIETLLNPVNAPVFIISLSKAMSPEDKRSFGEIYKNLAKKEIELFKLDFVYSEEKEAKFIKESYNFWQGIKNQIFSSIENAEKGLDRKLEEKEKGYFG
ncbi:MAG: hypothetical protein WDZ77_02115 [Candidatus Pacearchaeota archaeon]